MPEAHRQIALLATSQPQDSGANYFRDARTGVLSHPGTYRHEINFGTSTIFSLSTKSDLDAEVFVAAN